MGVNVDVMTKQSEFEITNPDAYQLVQYSQADDEISLVELWCLIKTHKRYLLIGLLLAWALAAIWLLLTVPVYKSETRLLPPPVYLYSEISVYDADEHYEPVEIFHKYIKQFKSVTNQQQFYDNNNLVTHFNLEGLSDDATKRLFTKRFRELLHINYGGKQRLPESATASFQLDDAELTAQWLNQYVDYIEQVTRNEMFNEFTELLNARKKLLRDQINLKRLVGKQRRQDQIARLEEAISVAKQLGIKSSSGASMNSKTSVEVNTRDIPLYRRGIEALSAELVALKSRKSDDPFIAELRSLEEQLGQLEMQAPDKTKVRTVQVDQPAIAAEHAENRSLPLAIILATVSGVLIGLILIFVKRFLQRVREAESLQIAE